MINEQAIVNVCQYLKLDPTRFASEMANAPYVSKTFSGKPYPSGTGETPERAFVYALVRMLTPDIVLEVGTGWGAMTTQILSACMNNNNGVVYSTDIVAQRWGRPVGSLIHSTMRTRLKTSINGSWQTDKPDLILEDSDHTYDTTKAHWLKGMQILPEGGVMLSHDATNKPDVLRAIRDCDVNPLVVQLEPKTPGFALWQKPTHEKTITPPMSTAITTPPQSFTPKSKRSARRAKSTN